MSLLSRPTVLLRYFPRLAAGYQDKPAVNELAMSITDSLTVAGAWIGKGELNLTETNSEELHRARAEKDRVQVSLLTFLLS
jgi:acetoacetate decarboxylase